MEGGERGDESLLPPDYVSLALLQERWLQKQEEKKQREKQEEEEEKRNLGRGKIGGGYVRDVVGRREGKIGGEWGLIDEKGKGKEVVIGGFENGEKNKKNKRKNRHSRMTNSAGEDGKGKEAEKEEVGSDNRVENGELKGIEEIASVSMFKVLPINGVKVAIPDMKRMDYRRGFRNNGYNRSSFNRSEIEHGGRYNQLKQNEGASAFGGRMEDGYDKKWGERGRKNSEYLKLN